MHTKCTIAANNKEQMNNKTNHTVNTLRQGTLTIYHKSASGEKQNSSAVRCKTEREAGRKKRGERERQRRRHGAVHHNTDEASY